MKAKKHKRHMGDMIGHIVIVSTLLGLLFLGYWSLKSNDSNKFQSIERLRGDHHPSALITPRV